MSATDDSLAELRSELETLLASGMAQEPIEHATQVAKIAAILHSAFSAAGFQVNRIGRHWRHGGQLFVELVSGPVAGPAEVVRVGEAEFRVVKKEVVLRDRLVGFKHWKHTAYGEQAIDMLAAFGDDLDMSWLHSELEREDALDALESLHKLAASNDPVTEQVLRDLIEDLSRRT